MTDSNFYGRAVITLQEQIELGVKPYLPASQIIMIALRTKGAPIEGAAILSPDSKYHWQVDRDYESGDITYSWSK